MRRRWPGSTSVSPRDLTAEPIDGCLSLVEAAELMGVPLLVLQRWCADGTVPEGDGFRGRPERPGALRIERAWVKDFMEQGEVTL